MHPEIQAADYPCYVTLIKIKIWIRFEKFSYRCVIIWVLAKRAEGKGMAKKKRSVELSDRDIRCIIDDIEYKIIRFYPARMTVDVKATEKNAQKGQQNIPFAHLPKATKQLIKPN